MPNDTVTLALNGEVTLEDFARALNHFYGLVNGLTVEVGESAEINWVVANLDYGSAITTARGESKNIQMVELVSRAFVQVGQALAGNRPIPYSAAITREALGLQRILGNRVPSIRFENAEQEVTVFAPDYITSVHPNRVALKSQGVIEGWIQSVSIRNGSRFTLRQSLDDYPVSCYLKEGQEAVILNLLGHRVIVEGLITRDPTSGKPANIRDITQVLMLPETPLGHYQTARGAVPWQHGELTPEEAIRRGRDAQ